MTTRRSLGIALATVCALALFGGCGGGGDSTTGGSGGSAYGGGVQGAVGNDGSSAAMAMDDGIVSADDSSDLGEILVDSAGRTLYLFEKDSGSESACYDACAAAWPPLLTKSGNPQAQGAADRSQLGTTKREDGTTQVTYAGHPLYTYAGDSAPGDTTGNDITQFGGEWYALAPAGEKPKD